VANVTGCGGTVLLAIALGAVLFAGVTPFDDFGFPGFIEAGGAAGRALDSSCFRSV
jgi:hypothetical protein